MEILTTQVHSMGRDRLYVCDRNCAKAWGVNGRRHDTASAIDFDGEDDIVYLSDDETGEAPANPGTYEGGHAKPMHPDSHNKWCVRECERCDRIEAGEPILVPDFSVRHYNQPWRHADAPAITTRDTGRRFLPDQKAPN